MPPASSQLPRFVPLGGALRDRRRDMRLTASGGALLPLDARGSNLGRVDFEARLQPSRSSPSRSDLDVGVQRWFKLKSLSAKAPRREPCSTRASYWKLVPARTTTAARAYALCGEHPSVRSTALWLARRLVAASRSAGSPHSCRTSFSGSPSTAASRMGVEVRVQPSGYAAKARGSARTAGVDLRRPPRRAPRRGSGEFVSRWSRLGAIPRSRRSRRPILGMPEPSNVRR